MKKTLLLICCCLSLACIRMPDPPAKTEIVTYTFKGGDDMNSLFKFTATYIDENNRTVRENIESLPWEKQILTPSPFKARLEVAFEAIPTTPDQPTYNVGFKGEILHSAIATTTSAPRQAETNNHTLRFAITLPDGATTSDAELTVAPLKYDKHFAFSFTVDDSSVNAWSRIFPLVHKKWIDDIEFFHLGVSPTTGHTPEYPLVITDGCGNDRRFGYGIAIWPTWGNKYSPEGFIKETSTSKYNPYITWEELRVMLDFGCAVHFHNVNEIITYDNKETTGNYDKTTPSQIAQGFKDDYDKAYSKLGRGMKVLALPDGNKAYIEAVMLSPLILFTRSSLTQELIRLKSCNGLYKKQTYGGEASSEVQTKLTELAKQAAAADPYWVGLTVHRPQQEYMDMLSQIADRYGKQGADNIWVASWDEVYEYQEFRHGAKISKSIEGRTVTFEVTLPDRPDFTFRDLSFTLKGAGGDCVVMPLSENIYGLSHASQNGTTLINICFDPELPARAEKYTSRYEATASQSDKEDALYFASMLRPELAAPFIYRIEHRKDRLLITNMEVNGGTTTVNSPNVKITLNIAGNPTHYRIGEKADLSACEWIEYKGEIAYTLSPDFGEKTIYVQVRSNTLESNVINTRIIYAEMQTSETISRDAVKAYQTKYNRYKVTIEKKIGGE